MLHCGNISPQPVAPFWLKFQISHERTDSA